MRKLIVLMFVLFLNSQLFASECYHYHVSTKYEIQVKNNEVFLRQNTVDPNGVSISQSNKIQLSFNAAENWKIDGVENNMIFLSTNNAYYFVSTEGYNFNEQKPMFLFKKSEVENRFNNNMFQQNGQWIFVTYDAWDKKIHKKKVPSVPENLQIIAKTQNNAYLVKNNAGVYVGNFQSDGVSFTKIEHLNPKTTQFIIPNYYLDAYLLYDDDTFYLTNINIENNEDVTNEFKSLGFKGDFTQLTFIKSELLSGFKDKNNQFWAYVEAGISLENADDVHFYPIENVQFTKDNSLLIADNKYYNSSWGAIYQTENIDVSKVNNPNDLQNINGSVYYDGLYYYWLNYETRAFEKEATLVGHLTMFDGVTSYQHSLASFFSLQNNTLYYFTGDQKVKKITAYSGTIKDVKVAYAFNDKMYIDDAIIPSPLNFETLEFVQSVVNVEQGCDGGRGQIPVVVHYYHFFKDATSLYVYATKTQTFQKIDDLKVATNFDTAYQWVQTQVGKKK